MHPEVIQFILLCYIDQSGDLPATSHVICNNEGLFTMFEIDQHLLLEETGAQENEFLVCWKYVDGNTMKLDG